MPTEKYLWHSETRCWRKWIWRGVWVPVLGPGLD